MINKNQDFAQTSKTSKWLIGLLCSLAVVFAVVSYVNYSCISGQTNWLTDLIYGDKCLPKSGIGEANNSQRLSVRGTTIELSNGGEVDLSFLVGTPLPGPSGTNGANGLNGAAGAVGATGVSGPVGPGATIPTACGPGELLTSNGTSIYCVPASGGGTLDDSYSFGGPGAGRIINAEPISTLGVEIRIPYDPGNFASYNTGLRLVGDGTGQNCLTCGMAFGKFDIGGFDGFGEIYSTNINSLMGSTFGYQLFQNFPGGEEYSIGLSDSTLGNYGALEINTSGVNLNSDGSMNIYSNGQFTSQASSYYFYATSENVLINGLPVSTTPGYSPIRLGNSTSSFEILDLCNGRIPVYGCVKVTAGDSLDPNGLVDGFAGSLYIASQTGVNASNALWVNTGSSFLNNNQWVAIGSGGGSSLQLYDENYTGSYLYGAPNATGQNSVAIGDGSSVSGILGTSVGNNISVNGSNSFAFGSSSTVNADSSGVVGNNNYIDLNSSGVFSFGQNNYSGQNQGTVTTLGSGNFLSDSIFETMVAGNNNGLSFGVSTSNIFGSNSSMGVGVNNSTLIGRSNSFGDGTTNSVSTGYSNIVAPGNTDLSILGGLNSIAQSNAYSQVIGRNNFFGNSNNDIAFLGNNNTVYDSSSLGLVIGNTNTIESSTLVVGGIGYRNTIGSGASQAYAFGVTNTVSSTGSYAFGENNTLSEGSSQLGVGFNNNVGNANNQVAVGSGNYLSSNNGQVGFGIGNTVNASGSSAIGQANLVNGNLSSGIGYANQVNGINSNGLGYANNVNGDVSGGIGLANNANNNISWAVGYSNGAYGQQSFSFGGQNTSTGQLGLSFGYGNNNDGLQSGAFGYANIIGPAIQDVYAYGYANNITAGLSLAYGNNNTINSEQTFVAGRNNYANGLAGLVFGSNNNMTGITGAVFGISNNNNGLGSFTLGQGNFVDSNSALNYVIGNSGSVNGSSNTYAFGQALSQTGISNNMLIGINISSTANDVIQLGQYGVAMTIQGDTIGGNVGIGTTTPSGVAASRNLQVTGGIRVGTLGAATATNVCINGSGDLSACSSSLRYKENIADLGLGLDAIMNLRAVSFDWKDNGGSDFGFIAEEVAAVNTLLATYNKDGEVQGVKYDQLTAILTNAIQEQQGKLEGINTSLNDQGLRIDDLAGGLKDLAERVDDLEKEFADYKIQTEARIRELERRTGGSLDSLPVEPGVVPEPAN